MTVAPAPPLNATAVRAFAGSLKSCSESQQAGGVLARELLISPRGPQRMMPAIPPSHRDTTRMMQQRRFKRMVIDVLEDGCLVLHMGEMEIWDGADLALLREGLTQLIDRDHARYMIIDMQFVKYIPSGFFGMLFDWHEKRGVTFALTTPQPNVQRMLWFQQFFRTTPDGWHELNAEGRDVLTPAGVGSMPSLIDEGMDDE